LIDFGGDVDDLASFEASKASKCLGEIREAITIIYFVPKFLSYFDLHGFHWGFLIGFNYYLWCANGIKTDQEPAMKSMQVEIRKELWNEINNCYRFANLAEALRSFRGFEARQIINITAKINQANAKSQKSQPESIPNH
jgi:hypothetical protein